MLAVYRTIRECAPKQCAHCSMRYDCKIPGIMRLDNLSDCPMNAYLCFGRWFPTAIATFRLSKENIGRCLEIVSRQVTGCAAVVLTKTQVAIHGQRSWCSKNLTCFAGFPLATGPYLRDVGQDSTGCKFSSAFTAQGIQAPLSYRDGRIDRDLGVCDDYEFRHLTR